MDEQIVGWFTTETGSHVPIMKNQSKKDAIEKHFSGKNLNKKDSFFSTIEHQTGVDLRKYQETGYGLDKKRGYVSIHLEDANPVDVQKVIDYVTKKGIRHESGGGFGETFYL